MGTHKDHHVTTVLFRWRTRARTAEAKLARVQLVLDATNERNRLSGDYILEQYFQSLAYKHIRDIMREDT